MKKYNDQKDIDRVYKLAELFDDDYWCLVQYCKENNLTDKQPKVLYRMFENLYTWHIMDLVGVLEKHSIYKIKSFVNWFKNKEKRVHSVKVMYPQRMLPYFEELYSERR